MGDNFLEDSWGVFRKFGNQKETLRKWFWTNFVKNNFSENCRQILGECSKYFRFAIIMNYLLTVLLVPHHEILSPRFLRMDLTSRSLLQNLGLSISQYGPCTRLINIKTCPMISQSNCEKAGQD